MNGNPCQTGFEPVLNVNQLKKLIIVNRVTLLRMARSGQLPGVRIGKLWRFRVSELNSWLTMEFEKGKERIR